ncbi:MAG: RNA polymerase sigma factor [bacterium]|nr:RNA polymerase sigma factor [bacterium]
MDSDDTLLLTQSAAGNESAFETLVIRYQKTVYFAAYRLIHNHADADDILQETFIRLYTTLQQGKTIENLIGWLYRTAVNLAIDKLRQRTRLKETTIESATSESTESIHIEVPDNRTLAPDEIAIGNERRTIIRRAIDSLPLQERTITILHDLEGLKIKEIAEILDCADGTVKSTLFHAHRRLRQKLLPLMLELRGEAGAKVEVSDSKLRYTSGLEQKKEQLATVKR